MNDVALAMPDSGGRPDVSWSPLAADSVLNQLCTWRRDGLSTALVTLVDIDGTTPRPLGAQMAVAEDGRFAGYLSGGCLEAAIAKEAQEAIRQRRNRLVRYGKGSRYVDIKLPCGSGLDLYIDQRLDGTLLHEMTSLHRRRRPFFLETHLEASTSRIIEPNDAVIIRSERDADVFRRAYCPAPRVVLIGSGPHFCSLAHFISAAGFDLDMATPDDSARSELSGLGLKARALAGAADVKYDLLDPWSAAVLAFHEHSWEVPVIAGLLRTKCFYIGGLGSKAAQEARRRGLAELGFSDDDLARVRGPIGLIPGAKSRITLAVGVLAEIVAEAKLRNFVQ